MRADCPNIAILSNRLRPIFLQQMGGLNIAHTRLQNIGALSQLTVLLLLLPLLSHCCVTCILAASGWPQHCAHAPAEYWRFVTADRAAAAAVTLLLHLYPCSKWVASTLLTLGCKTSELCRS
jgi:hypothetical protein